MVSRAAHAARIPSRRALRDPGPRSSSDRSTPVSPFCAIASTSWHGATTGGVRPGVPCGPVRGARSRSGDVIPVPPTHRFSAPMSMPGVGSVAIASRQRRSRSGRRAAGALRLTSRSVRDVLRRTHRADCARERDAVGRVGPSPRSCCPPSRSRSRPSRADSTIDRIDRRALRTRSSRGDRTTPRPSPRVWCSTRWVGSSNRPGSRAARALREVDATSGDVLRLRALAGRPLRRGPRARRRSARPAHVAERGRDRVGRDDVRAARDLRVRGRGVGALLTTARGSS